jgi:hypothetical protein
MVTAVLIKTCTHTCKQWLQWACSSTYCNPLVRYKCTYTISPSVHCGRPNLRVARTARKKTQSTGLRVHRRVYATLGSDLFFVPHSTRVLTRTYAHVHVSRLLEYALEYSVFNPKPASTPSTSCHVRSCRPGSCISRLGRRDARPVSILTHPTWLASWCLFMLTTPTSFPVTPERLYFKSFLRQCYICTYTCTYHGTVLQVRGTSYHVMSQLSELYHGTRVRTLVPCPLAMLCYTTMLCPSQPLCYVTAF